MRFVEYDIMIHESVSNTRACVMLSHEEKIIQSKENEKRHFFI